MRIIAGEYRGRVIKAPKGDGTRPTTDRVRESLMSALASARGGLEGAVVLDAFAGSGALGLEALSRGAASACFFERDGAAASVVSGNMRTLGLEPRRARLVRADVLEKPPFRQRPAFDLVFLDPPYALAAEESLRMVANLAKTGRLGRRYCGVRACALDECRCRRVGGGVWVRAFFPQEIRRDGGRYPALDGYARVACGGRNYYFAPAPCRGL